MQYFPLLITMVAVEGVSGHHRSVMTYLVGKSSDFAGMVEKTIEVSTLFITQYTQLCCNILVNSFVYHINIPRCRQQSTLLLQFVLTQATWCLAG